MGQKFLWLAFLMMLSLTGCAGIPSLMCGGVEMRMGEKVKLGENSYFSATTQISEMGSFITVELDGLSLGQTGQLPDEGGASFLDWLGFIQVEISRCGGKYFYRLISLTEPIPLVPDKDCTDGFYEGGLRYPFTGRTFVHGDKNDGVVIISGHFGWVGVSRQVKGYHIGGVALPWPEPNKEAFVSIGVDGGMLFLRIKDCSGRLFWNSKYVHFLAEDSSVT